MKNLCLALAIACFAIFAANVVIGASGAWVFLTDIQEMLALFAACIFFVAAVLMIERRALRLKAQDHDFTDDITGRR